MYPVLIFREEAVCLVALLLLLLTSGTYSLGRESRSFQRLLWYAIAHIVFEMASLFLANTPELQYDIPVRLVNSVYFVSDAVFCAELFYYLMRRCVKQIPSWSWSIIMSVNMVFATVVPFLPYDIEGVRAFNYYDGPACLINYTICINFLMAGLIMVAIRSKQLLKSARRFIVPTLICLILVETAQHCFPGFMLTGGAATLLMLGLFFSSENPAYVFESKVMIDALTGVQSRHSYEIALRDMERRFAVNPTSEYTFLFCDINNLKAVNGRFGHHEGDHYITMIATILMSNLKRAYNVYRMGGDEFLALYRNVPETVVLEEIEAVRMECEKAAESMDYIPAVAMGYAISGSEYASLRDVLRTADYMMYRNKADLKRTNNYYVGQNGTRLNLTGLTDRIFDAMCSSNSRSYPYLINMETGVARVSPAWAEYFGLENDFLTNIEEVWLKRVHPDDRDIFLTDFRAAYSGRRKYHNADYRALGVNGEYVTVSCHGAVYHGKDGTPDIFAGYLVNHGVEETIDNITSLRNMNAIRTELDKLSRVDAEAVIMKISIFNFKRVNMLYSYESGNVVLKRFGELLRSVVGSEGEVFRHSGADYAVLIPGGNRERAEVIYNVVREHAMTDVVLDQAVVPLIVSGGAYCVRTNTISNQDEIWRSLFFAVEESAYNKGGNLVFYSDYAAKKSNPDGDLLSMIHHDALTGKNYFRLRYQPIYNTQSRRMVGAEALIRWDHPDFGEVPPIRFIEFLESDPCYFELGRFILRRALIDAAEIKRVLPEFTISVNITALQLQREDFIPSVTALLEETGFPAHDLILELTERCKTLDVDFLRMRLYQLKRAGIRIALDDMGTGYSTISLLLRLPFDEIKFDRDFVAHMQDSDTYQLFADAMMRGTGYMPYEICFEGVENEETLDYLKSLGRSLVQGYHLSMPVYLQELTEKAEQAMKDMLTEKTEAALAVETVDPSEEAAAASPEKEAEVYDETEPGDSPAETPVPEEKVVVASEEGVTVLFGKTDDSAKNGYNTKE